MACVVAAPTSASGKTLLSLILSAWAHSLGLNLQPFKVGPDYLDAQQLTNASGRPCRNLDLVMCGPDWVTDSFYGYSSNADLALVEGVMGLFDGIGSTSDGSTAAIAHHLNLPILLIIDARKQAGSIAALIKGFTEYDQKLNITGVILNRVYSTRHKELLKEAINRIGIKVLGCLPEDPALSLRSRHLGLVPPHETKDLEAKVDKWAEIANKNLDMKSIKPLLQAPRSSIDPIKQAIKRCGKDTNFSIQPIAVAQDNAFHFTYSENKEILEAIGMPILPWKPLENEPIPIEAKGVILPGGFPEDYAHELSQCTHSMNELRNCYGNIPIYAECGGMMFLGKSITNEKGRRLLMTGLLPINAQKGKLHVGYRNLKVIQDGLIVRKGEMLYGHEFHRWELVNTTLDSDNSTDQLKDSKVFISNQSLWKVNGWGVNSKEEGWSSETFHASWIHLHWASNIQLALRWREAVVLAQRNKET